MFLWNWTWLPISRWQRDNWTRCSILQAVANYAGLSEDYPPSPDRIRAKGKTRARSFFCLVTYLCKLVNLSPSCFFSTYRKRAGLSVLSVQGMPALSSCGKGCCLIFRHRCSISFDVGHSSTQIRRFLNSSMREGCLVSAKPWPTRLAFSNKAS